MKALKTLFITLLSFILILAPVSVSATSITTPTTTPLPIKLPANVTKADVIKRMRVVGAELAIHIVIQQLLKGVDYVMDPENNRAKSKNKVYCYMVSEPCVDSIEEAEKDAKTSIIYTAWKYPFTGCKLDPRQGNGTINCTFEQNGDIRTIAYYSLGHKTASEDQIAEQVFANARQGNK